MCGLRALLGRGTPFLLRVLDVWWGTALMCFGVPSRSLAMRRGRVMKCGGSPPSFPPLAAARVKLARPFGWYPSLIPCLSHAVHGERALMGFFTFLWLHPVLPGPLPCGPMAGLALWFPHVGWVDHSPCWCK